MLKHLAGLLFGGAGGGYQKVSAMNAQVRANPCPKCGEPLGSKKPGRGTWTQRMWGGWTCPECGCDVDRFGKERPPK